MHNKLIEDIVIYFALALHSYSAWNTHIGGITSNHIHNVIDYKFGRRCIYVILIVVFVKNHIREERSSKLHFINKHSIDIIYLFKGPYS